MGMKGASWEGVMGLPNVRELDHAGLGGQAFVFGLRGRVGWGGVLFPMGERWWWQFKRHSEQSKGLTHLPTHHEEHQGFTLLFLHTGLLAC